MDATFKRGLVLNKVWHGESGFFFYSASRASGGPD
jgi:hypothetical protein